MGAHFINAKRILLPKVQREKKSRRIFLEDIAQKWCCNCYFKKPSVQESPQLLLDSREIPSQTQLFIKDVAEIGNSCDGALCSDNGKGHSLAQTRMSQSWWVLNLVREVFGICGNLVIAGHTRKISIPGCVEFLVTTNACRGFCESYAVPSAYGTVMKPMKPVTSIGQCCNIMGTQNVIREVLCLDGYRNVTFKSATDCSCYHCKKD